MPSSNPPQNSPQNPQPNPSRNAQIQAKFEAFKNVKLEFSTPVPLKQAIPYAVYFGFYVGGLTLLHTKAVSIWTDLLLTFTAIFMAVVTYFHTNDRNSS